MASGTNETMNALLDATTRAVATMTSTLPEPGCRAPEYQMKVDQLYKADIGVPPTLWMESAVAL